MTDHPHTPVNQVRHPRARWRSPLLLFASVLLWACSDQPTDLDVDEVLVEAPSASDRSDGEGEWGELHGKPAAHAGHKGRVLRNWLRQVRRVTRRFHRIDRAFAAGWDTPLTGCMDSPDGGMGIHYGNVALIDGVAEAARPEVLLYEPLPNGRLRLVAVEYIVPFDAWDGSEPPELNGVPFHENEAFGLWVLHLWAWKANPNGALEDWNPRVSCRFAS